MHSPRPAPSTVLRPPREKACPHEDPSDRTRPRPPAHVVLHVPAAPRPAAHRRRPQGGRPRRGHLLPAVLAHRLGRPAVGGPRRDLGHHVDGAGRLRDRRARARARRAGRRRRVARHLHGRRGARARRLRGARRGRRDAHARAHRRPAGRARARDHRRPLVHARGRGRPQPAARGVPRPGHAAGAGPHAHRRLLRAARHDPHHDQLGLPLRLQLLLGHGHVRAQVPLPQPRAHHGRDRGQAAAGRSSSTTTTSPPTSAGSRRCCA